MTIKDLLSVLPENIPVEMILNSAECEDDSNNVQLKRDNLLYCDAFLGYVIDRITPTSCEFNNGCGEGILIYIKTETRPIKKEV